MALKFRKRGGWQMSLPRAGVSLVVENDKAFKDALSEVNAGLKVNKQQM